MCYSAMVKQEVDRLGFRFDARIQYDLYESLFRRRQAGERLMINKAMEYPFTHSSDHPQIRSSILQWHSSQVEKVQSDLRAQEERLQKAVAALAIKTTVKAQEDRRIATAKIEKFKQDLQKHRSIEILNDLDQRVFPFHFVSMLCLDERGQRVIRPARYHLRPAGETEAFDRKFNGCYNARLDNLDNVRWWKSALGQRHGLLMISKFYENVQTVDYLQKFSLNEPEAKKENIVLCFSPDQMEFMFVPTLWDYWQGKDGQGFYSTALITDEPAPEVAETGHNRTPIFLKESAIEEWLSAKGQSTAELKTILDQRERPHYSHALELAG